VLQKVLKIKYMKELINHHTLKKPLKSLT